MLKIKLYILFALIGCSSTQLAFGSMPVDTLKILNKAIMPLGRLDRGIVNHTIVPKKQVLLGLSASYTTFINDDYELLSLLKDFDAQGYMVSVKPFVGYFFKDNQMAGLRMGYSRTFLRLDNVSIDLDDDMNFSVSDVYLLEHQYSGTGLIRSYINIGNSKRFALFNETSITFSAGTAKMLRGSGESLNGTHSKIQELHVGVAPGLTAFIMDNVGVEVSFGVAGFKYREQTQVHNQVEHGSRRNSGANFKIDLFKISLGLAVYL